MNDASHDWLRIKALFAGALDQPEAQRARWLVQECAGNDALLLEVNELLAEHVAPSCSLLDNGATPLLAALSQPANVEDSTMQPGAMAGPYRLLRLLGEGGMGRVFLAERADGQFRQQVALKLIRSDYATSQLRERFVREREILARLVHPNIASLHDGGVSADGSPYFTLEYVEGWPLTRWCDEHSMGIVERVRLFIKVCDAVQHAHRNLIVHRDLKPSNILVSTDGEPKLLDFGIAKLLDTTDMPGLTGTQSRPMTREYAAPEQVLGEAITTATDVYALGVLLYELLCGHLPYARAERGETSWPKAIIEENPESMGRAMVRATTSSAAEAAGQLVARARSTALSALRRSLRGDLDRIAQRALEKAPEARYPSVTALTADLRAWLDGRALPGGNRRYRIWKFIQRNHIAVGFSSLLLVVVVAGLIVVALQERRVAVEARKALRQSQTTAAVKDFLLDLFHKADPNVSKGKEVTARDLVDRGVQRLEKIPASQPVLKAELETTLGTIYFQLGLYKEAAGLHERAFEALKSLPDETALAVVAERDAATELTSMGDLERAQRLADDAVARLRAQATPPRNELVKTLGTAGWIALKRIDGAHAKQVGIDALALARQPPVDDKVLSMALDQMANADWLQHDYAAATDVYRETFALNLKNYGADDEHTLSAQLNVAAALYGSAQFAAARPQFETVLANYERVFGKDHDRALYAGQGLALVDYESGRYREARERLEHIVAIVESKSPKNERMLAEMRVNLGEVLADLGQLDAAAAMLQSTQQFFSMPASLDHAGLAEALSELGYVHVLQGKLEAAEAELRQALAERVEVGESDQSMELARASDVRRLRGDTSEALTLAEKAVINALQIHGERSRHAAWSHYCHALALLAAARNAEAETEMRAALASFSLLAPPDGMHPASAGARLLLGKTLATQPGHSAEALALLRQALKLYGDNFGADHPSTIQARAALMQTQSAR